jgi:hypothetical protein
MLKVKCSSVGHFHGMRLKNFPFFGQCVVQVKPKANTCLIVGILEKRVLNAQKTTIVDDVGARLVSKSSQWQFRSVHGGRVLCGSES